MHMMSPDYLENIPLNRNSLFLILGVVRIYINNYLKFCPIIGAINIAFLNAIWVTIMFKVNYGGF